MVEQSEAEEDRRKPSSLPDVRVPALWTFIGLAAGLLAGMLTQGTSLQPFLLSIAEPVGALWLRALKMTIVPLVAALLVTGIVQMVAAAGAGAMARRTLGLFALLLFTGAVLSALIVPPLVELLPIPQGATAALSGGLAAATGPVPGIADFLATVVPENIVAAAASDAMLSIVAFFAVLALAITRLADAPRSHLSGLFEAIAGAMLIVIGWVLAIAPVGVLALGYVVAANSGGAAIGALMHYILVVSSIGVVVFLGGYVMAGLAARQGPQRFARAMLPVQAVAISTQSSLASLPAMLEACRKLGVREATADFVLPLAVALFRATGPAMNLAVAIYVAKLAGVPITPGMLVAGVAAATLTTLGAPSLPGSISFVTSIAPIAVAMGVPIGPLALLVAVEMLPDIMRTLGNVTMDVAVTATVDRRTRD
ncbi:MAG: cation:dicarboxylase symporter family transporter [Novosphingobium sp.]